MPNFIVLAYPEVAKLAKPGQTDRPTEIAIATCHLVKCHKNHPAIKKNKKLFTIYIKNIIFNIST